jgi:hypothetical protein
VKNKILIENHIFWCYRSKRFTTLQDPVGQIGLLDMQSDKIASIALFEFFVCSNFVDRLDFDEINQRTKKIKKRTNKNKKRTNKNKKEQKRTKKNKKEQKRTKKNKKEQKKK